MTTTIAAVRPEFTFAAAEQDFSLIRNASDHYSILDSAGSTYTMFSYGGDPEDSFELEAAAVAAVEYKITHGL
ncbi:hypothetical protein [Paenarthrobacter sp. YJN-5]|uniref:hypothetical protein n=1 Tax=Paenarthrobacter sp. YJN-5 TaxID=2735316 RepID=UPI0018782F8D|nr:hypothetical protein [Paenarthrobacter sp. YJN-5]QOT19534.1 hypothetical protein HMI59_23165 [Paenarthrobacter sp. YJN-5]